MRSRLLLATGAALALTLACLVPKPELEGLQCDFPHPCIEGYRCTAEGICVPLGSEGPDAAGLDGGTQCTGSGRVCNQEGNLVACVNRVLVVEPCASAGEGCDPARGCLPNCPLESGECPAGRACDQAAQLCVRSPACANDGDCAAGARCSSGACLAEPAEVALVFVGMPATPDGGPEPDANQGKVEADLSCYRDPPDAGGVPTSPDGGPTGVVFKGLLLDLGGRATPATVGYNIDLFRAEDFAQKLPPFASTIATKRSELEDKGFFQFPEPVPVEVDLVAHTYGTGAGGIGAIDTYEYFRLRWSDAEVLNGVWVVTRVALRSYDAVNWSKLLGGVAAMKDRAAVAGQLYDCRTAPLPIEGATAALTVQANASYTIPNTVGIDPKLTATSSSGRFFFFDVPVVDSLGVVVGALDARMYKGPLRTVKNSITLVSISPSGR